jgi:hypothetical protein
MLAVVTLWLLAVRVGLASAIVTVWLLAVRVGLALTTFWVVRVQAPGPVWQ